jgi:hypothetical protein
VGWKISKATFRAMIDRALGLSPEDMSEAAKAKRVLRGLADLDGITFVVKIRIEPNRNPAYKDANRLDHVVLPTAPEWQKVMAGEAVPVQPSHRSRPAAPAPVSPAPAWGQTQPAGSSADPAWSAPAAQPAADPAAPTTAGGPAWLNP